MYSSICPNCNRLIEVEYHCNITPTCPNCGHVGYWDEKTDSDASELTPYINWNDTSKVSYNLKETSSK